MFTFALLTLLLMLTFVGLMTVGVVFGRPPLRGSCGGNPEACLCKGARDRPQGCVARSKMAGPIEDRGAPTEGQAARATAWKTPTAREALKLFDGPANRPSLQPRRTDGDNPN